MGINKRRVKLMEKQSLKRNEKNIRALKRQQKECWGGGLHSKSNDYALQNFMKKSDNSMQKAS